MTVNWGKDRFRRFGGRLRNLSAFVKQARPPQLKKEMWKDIFRRIAAHRRAIAKTFAATVVLFGVSAAGNQYVATHTYEIYHVYVGEQKIGTVSDPLYVQQAINERRREAQLESPDIRMELDASDVRLVSERVFNGEYDNVATLQKLGDMLEPHAIGVELYVGGERVAVLKTEEEAAAILEKIKSKYIGPDKRDRDVAVLSAAAGDSDDTEVRFLQSVEFTEEVEIVESRIDPSEIMDGDNVLAALSALGEAPQKYTVQPGDCLSCIASKFGMKGVEELRLLNPWIVDDTIYPGDEMIVRGFQPKLGVKTVEIEITQEEIQHDTIYEQDPTLRIGKTKVLKPGMNGLKKVTYELTSINGQLINEELIAEEVLVEPVSAVVAKGTLRLAGEGTGKFAWPVSGAKLTSSFGKRWGRMHEGIDLASSNRTIKAADSGKVTFAGTKNGYGKTVIIDHSNGYQTLYAHLSKITVSKGDIVEKGDQVGVMGSTGNSTGVHLHFEIHKDGEPKNPISYLNK